MGEPRWLTWAKRLQALSQTGLAYANDPFDRERYEALRELAAEIMAAGSDAPLEHIAGLFAQQNGYTTPKVDVRAAVFREGRILLVREKTDGGWTLPGGWADVNESPRECVEKEVREESGFEVRAVKLAAAWDRTRQGHEPPFAFHVYKLYFLCEITGGEAALSIETTDVGFFAEDEIPPLSHSRVLPHQIRRMFDHHRSPALPTDFD